MVIEPGDKVICVDAEWSSDQLNIYSDPAPCPLIQGAAYIVDRVRLDHGVDLSGKTSNFHPVVYVTDFPFDPYHVQRFRKISNHNERAQADEQELEPAQ